MEKRKLAVPVVLGVPVICTTKELSPSANLPNDRVAVRPLTPVDDTVWLE
jgi:hypothetical protein